MIIEVDPHKSSLTATAVDAATDTPVASLRVDASLAGYRDLLRWGKQFDGRRWAVEGARGLGRHRAQWLVARDESVVDVPSTATARVRELSRGSRRKTDVIDAAAAACVAASQGDTTPVTSEDHTTVFAMLEERRANLAARRVRVANQSSMPFCATSSRVEPLWRSPPRQHRCCCARSARYRCVSGPARSSPRIRCATCGPWTLRWWPSSNE